MLLLFGVKHARHIHLARSNCDGSFALIRCGKVEQINAELFSRITISYEIHLLFYIIRALLSVTLKPTDLGDFDAREWLWGNRVWRPLRLGGAEWSKHSVIEQLLRCFLTIKSCQRKVEEDLASVNNLPTAKHRGLALMLSSRWGVSRRCLSSAPSSAEKTKGGSPLAPTPSSIQYTQSSRKRVDRSPRLVWQKGERKTWNTDQTERSEETPALLVMKAKPNVQTKLNV